jgi:ABC-type branched-subunit amino acid transport system ATPase component
MSAPAVTENKPQDEEAQAPQVDHSWRDEELTVTKIAGKDGKAIEDVKFPVRYKVYKGFQNLVAAFGGEAVAENVLASAHDNRTKGKASTTLRQKIKKGASVEEAIKAAQAVAESFVYSERGVSAKKVGEAAQNLQKEMEAQNLDPDNMDPDQMREWIRKFRSL